MIDPRIALFGVGSLLFGALIVVQLTTGAQEGLTVAPAVARRDGGPSKQPSLPPPIEPLVTTILARPLFSPERRPPEGPRSAGADLKDKRFAGIVIEPYRRLAIFAVTGAKPLTVTEGDSVDGWRIESITPDEIALVSTQGSRTLQPMPAPANGEGRTQRRKIIASPGAAARHNPVAETAQPDPKTPAAATAKSPIWTAGGNGTQPPTSTQTSRTAQAPGAPQPSVASQPAGFAPAGRRFTQPPLENQRNAPSSPTGAGIVSQRP
jgi:hypothetical protein